MERSSPPHYSAVLLVLCDQQSQWRSHVDYAEHSMQSVATSRRDVVPQTRSVATSRRDVVPQTRSVATRLLQYEQQSRTQSYETTSRVYVVLRDYEQSIRSAYTEVTQSPQYIARSIRHNISIRTYMRAICCQGNRNGGSVVHIWGKQ